MWLLYPGLRGGSVRRAAARPDRERDVAAAISADEAAAVGEREAADHSIDARINLVNLGDAQILTIPGEALPNIGFYLKRKMRGRHNLLFGLTNDALGYILTEVDFDSFPRYQYVSRTSLGEKTGSILIEQSLKLVEQSPRQ